MSATSASRSSRVIQLAPTRRSRPGQVAEVEPAEPLGHDDQAARPLERAEVPAEERRELPVAVARHPHLAHRPVLRPEHGVPGGLDGGDVSDGHGWGLGVGGWGLGVGGWGLDGRRRESSRPRGRGPALEGGTGMGSRSRGRRVQRPGRPRRVSEGASSSRSPPRSRGRATERHRPVELARHLGLTSRTLTRGGFHDRRAILPRVIPSEAGSTRWGPRPRGQVRGFGDRPRGRSKRRNPSPGLSRRETGPVERRGRRLGRRTP